MTRIQAQMILYLLATGYAVAWEDIQVAQMVISEPEQPQYEEIILPSKCNPK